MQYLFPYAANQEPYKGNVLTLKDIGKIVDLGYSTVLHKYKDYREKGEVQKGLLLVCKDFKRKYTKSLVIEDAIKSALKEKQFKTAK
jgi:thiamine monophosphate synthase